MSPTVNRSEIAGDEGTGADTGLIAQTGRLFLRNLPYQATEADLAALFEEYGELSEVHLILDRCELFTLRIDEHENISLTICWARTSTACVKS